MASSRMGSARRITVALVGLVLLVLVGWAIQNLTSGDSAPSSGSPGSSAAQGTSARPGTSAGPRSSAGPAASVASIDGMAVRPLSELPAEAKQTWDLIAKGGPFPHPRNDGVTFQNREKLLPAKKSGYYKEYTVRTPGSDDRGARRLVTGAERELFYTDDHYASFVVVDPAR